MAIVDTSNNSDVEVEFDFIGVRKHPAYNGYRPAHMVKK